MAVVDSVEYLSKSFVNPSQDSLVYETRIDVEMHMVQTNGLAKSSELSWNVLVAELLTLQPKGCS